MSNLDYLDKVHFNYPFYCFLGSSLLVMLSLVLPVIAIVQADLPFFTYSVMELYDLGETTILICLVLSLLLGLISSFIFYNDNENKSMIYSLIGVKLIVDIVAFIGIRNVINRLNRNDFDDRIIVFEDTFTFGSGSYFLVLSFSIAIVGLVLDYNYSKSIK